MVPLSKKRDKARKRIDRAMAVQPNSNLNPVQPTGSIDGLIMDGNRIVGIKPKQVGQAEAIKPNIPVYSPYEHYEPGDRVLVQRGKRMIETVIPEVDADGNAIYEEG